MEQLKKKVRIVPMTNEYLNDVAELERTCFSNPWSRNMLAEELENACSAFLVALDAENGSVVGYAGLLAVVDEGCITKMAVRPDCRRGGVAGQLLDVFIRFAEGSGLAFLTLEVRESNYAAIALYGSRGFRGEGRRKPLFPVPAPVDRWRKKRIFHPQKRIRCNFDGNMLSYAKPVCAARAANLNRPDA